MPCSVEGAEAGLFLLFITLELHEEACQFGILIGETATVKGVLISLHRLASDDLSAQCQGCFVRQEHV